MAVPSKNQLCLRYENGFPYKGSPEERLKFLVNFAAMSPSLGRSSPWRFDVHLDRLVLHLDASRARRATDPDIRELVISCGMALEHMRLAARRFRQDMQPNLLPDGFPGPLAEIGLRVGAPPSKADDELFNAIFDWAKPHQRFVPKELNATGLGNLLRVPEGAWPAFRHQWSLEERMHLAGLIVEGDRLHQQAEEERLTRIGQVKRRREDRLRVAKKGKEILAEKLDEWTSRLFHGGRLIAPARRLAEAKPSLVVLSTKGDDPADWLETGRLLANTLLRGLIWGVRPSLVNAFMRYPQLRQELAGCLGPGLFPQVVFRLGISEKSKASAPAVRGGLAFEDYL